MTKYGWRRVARDDGWMVETHQLLNKSWLGAVGRDRLIHTAQGLTEAEVLDDLEAWWRAHEGSEDVQGG